MSEFITILTIFVIVSILTLTYMVLSKNLKSYKIKIDEAESVLDELLKEKYDSLFSIGEIITNETEVDNKVFTNLKNIKKQNLSVFDFDKKLDENYELIKQIIDDYSEIYKNKEFNKIIKNISNLDEKLEATKVFYNKYAEDLNSMATKIPINILAKLHRVEDKDYFEIN